MAQRVRREIKAILRKGQAEAILIEVNPAVAALLIGTGGAGLRELERETGHAIYIRGSTECHLEKMNLKAIGSREEVEKKARPVQPGQVLDINIEEGHVTNPDDGIARVEGYVVDIEGGSRYIGQRVKVQVTGAYRTYAKARVVAGPETEAAAAPETIPVSPEAKAGPESRPVNGREVRSGGAPAGKTEGRRSGRTGRSRGNGRPDPTP